AFARQLFREQFFQHLAIFEIHGDVDVARDVGLSDVELLEKGRKEFGWIKLQRGALLRGTGESARSHAVCGGYLVRVGLEFWQLFPEELSPIQHPAAAHVKQIHGEHSVLKMISENISVITLGS